MCSCTERCREWACRRRSSPERRCVMSSPSRRKSQRQPTCRARVCSSATLRPTCPTQDVRSELSRTGARRRDTGSSVCYLFPPLFHEVVLHIIHFILENARSVSFFTIFSGTAGHTMVHCSREGFVFLLYFFLDVHLKHIHLSTFLSLINWSSVVASVVLPQLCKSPLFFHPPQPQRPHTTATRETCSSLATR